MSLIAEFDVDCGSVISLPTLGCTDSMHFESCFGQQKLELFYHFNPMKSLSSEVTKYCPGVTCQLKMVKGSSCKYLWNFIHLCYQDLMVSNDKNEMWVITRNLLDMYSCLKDGLEPTIMVLFSLGTLQIIFFSYQLTIKPILLSRTWMFMTMLLIQIIITGINCGSKIHQIYSPGLNTWMFYLKLKSFEPKNLSNIFCFQCNQNQNPQMPQQQA